MRILVYTKDITAGEWVKETLQEFGRGMHITVADESRCDLLGGKWSYIIAGGTEIDGKVDKGKFTSYPLPKDEGEQAAMRRNLWALYRDTLRDMTGAQCSCGLYDICHCH